MSKSTKQANASSIIQQKVRDKYLTYVIGLSKSETISTVKGGFIVFVFISVSYIRIGFDRRRRRKTPISVVKVIESEDGDDGWMVEGRERKGKEREGKIGDMKGAKKVQ